MRRPWPSLTGSRHYLSGLFTPGTVMLQPAGYIRALAQGLRAAGVRIAETSPVLRLARQGAGWQLVTPHGRIAAGKVILANNGQIESFGFGRGRLMHLFLYASMTADLGPEALGALGGAPRWGITPSDPMGTTMRRIDGPQGGNRLVTRTCATFEPGMEASEAALRRTAAVHRRKFAERFPALGAVRMEFSWAGHLCLSRNGVAMMREPRARALCGLRAERPRHHARHPDGDRRGRTGLGRREPDHAPFHRRGGSDAPAARTAGNPRGLGLSALEGMARFGRIGPPLEAIAAGSAWPFVRRRRSRPAR